MRNKALVSKNGRARAATFVVLAASLACGLVSSDVLSFQFNIPPKQYKVDTASFALPAATLPNAPCGTATDCCAAAALVGVSCATTPLSCDAMVCAYHGSFESVSTMDLKTDAPEFGSLKQSAVSITLNKVDYTVMNNTLNMAVPEVDIYLAPANVMTAEDPQAVLWGVVPPIPAGTDPSGNVVLQPSAAGANTTFNKFAANWSTPFNFITKVNYVVVGGQPAPTGSLEVTVSGQATAKPSL